MPQQSYKILKIAEYYKPLQYEKDIENNYSD